VDNLEVEGAQSVQSAADDGLIGSSEAATGSAGKLRQLSLTVLMTQDSFQAAWPKINPFWTGIFSFLAAFCPINTCCNSNKHNYTNP